MNPFFRHLAPTTRGVVSALTLAFVASLTLSLPGPPPARAAGSTDPVAHWTFDEGTGATAADLSGNANDGTITGATWTTGRDGAGGALSFVAGNRVDIPTAATLETDSVTVAGWFKATTTSASGRVLLQKGATACTSLSYQLVQSGKGVEFLVRKTNGGYVNAVMTSVNQSGLPTLWDGSWHHVAGTYDAMTGQARVYIDGLLAHQGLHVSGGAAAIAHEQADTEGLVVGHHAYPCTVGRFVGTADDIQLFDHALSQAELNELVPADIATTTTLDPITPSPSLVGESLVIVARVTGSPPGGTVTFYRTSAGVETAIAIQPVLLGAAYLYIEGPFLWSYGTYGIRAEFSGGGRWQPSTSGTVTHKVNRLPTTIEFQANPNPAALNETFTMVARTSQGGGTIRFYELTSGGSVLLAEKPNSNFPYVSGSGATLDLSYASISTHKFYAIFSGTSLLAPATSTVIIHKVDKPVPWMQLTGPTGAVQTHHPAIFVTTLGAPPESPLPAPTGSIKYTDTFNGVTTTLGYRTGGQSMSPTKLAVGTHRITAIYSGDAVYKWTSQWVEVTIIPDTVDVTGLGLTAAGFYPIVDGYGDTVGIKGTLSETAGVTITIKNTGGTTVRTLSLGQRNGAYQASWNGLNTSGLLVPAGTYTVTQTLKDSYGSTVVWNGTVSVSHKKLVWTTTSTTMLATQYAAKGTYGVGTAVTTTKYSGGMKIASGVGGYAALGYQFTLPAATSYKSITLAVIGSGAAAEFGAHDFRLGTWPAGGTWIIDYFSPLKATSTSYVWTSQGVDPVSHRSGQTVHAMVLAGPATYYLHKVKLTYSYAVLK